MLLYYYFASLWFRLFFVLYHSKFTEIKLSFNIKSEIFRKIYSSIKIPLFYLIRGIISILNFIKNKYNFKQIPVYIEFQRSIHQFHKTFGNGDAQTAPLRVS